MKDRDLIETMARELQPVKPLPAPLAVALVWFLGAVVFAGLGFLFLPFREDLSAKLSEPSFLFQGAGLVLVAVLSAAAVSWIGRPGRACQKTLAAAALVGIGLLMSFLAVQAALRSEEAHFWETRCLEAVVLLGVIPVLLFFRRAREAAPVYPGLSGALIGIAAGAVGALALSLSCWNDGPLHLLYLHHLLPLLLLGGAGFLLGRKYLRW